MTAQRTSRRRGAMLTVAGYAKLQLARSKVELAANCGSHTKEDLTKLTGLSLNTIAKIFGNTPSLSTAQKVPVDKQSLDLCFTAFDLILERQDYLYPEIVESAQRDRPSDGGSCQWDLELEKITPHPPDRVQQSSSNDWGEAPDVAICYGRMPELAQLTQWVNQDRCKLVLLLGMGGMGKTFLVTKLAQQLTPDFTTIVWRSLSNAPSLTNLLSELIEVFADRAETVPPMMNISTQISRLLYYFRQKRCLLVLDCVEALIQGSSQSDSDRSEYSGYAELFERIGSSAHQSCLLLTSREKPDVIVPLEGNRSAVRTFTVPGLAAQDSQNLFDDRGISGSNRGRARLWEIYSGNPLALKIVTTSIRDLFDGDCDRFLKAKTLMVSGIQQLLDRQFESLSPAEVVVMYWLAIEGEWISPADLQAQILPFMMMPRLMATLESLRRKSLIEHHDGTFTQQAIVKAYTIGRAIERVATELIQLPNPTASHSELPLWLSHPLFKVRSRTELRTRQTELILAPIASQVQSQFFNRAALERHLHSLTIGLQTHYRDRSHYGVGNLINLLRYWQIDLRNYDFTNLPIWQANLQGAILHNVDFSGADLTNSTFTSSFGWISTVSFSPDSQLLVTGELNGDLSIWQVQTRKPIAKFRGHTSWVVSISFSPDGRILASMSQDGTVRLWDVLTGKVIHLFEIDLVPTSISFQVDGEMLAVGYDDGTMRLWDVLTGESTETHSLHPEQPISRRFSPDERLFASGRQDRSVKSWASNPFDLHMVARADVADSVRFSPDDKLLAIDSNDGKIQIWELATWQMLTEIETYPDSIFSICVSPDRQILAAGNSLNQVNIWEIDSWRRRGNVRHTGANSPVAVATLNGHQAFVSSIQFSPDGKLLATSGSDRTLRLWDTQNWQELFVWQGYTNSIWSLAFTPDGDWVVSGAPDGSLRLWDVGREQIVRVLSRQQGTCAVDYHPNGRWHSADPQPTIACGNIDGSVQVWDIQTGELLQVIAAHQGTVWQVRFNPDCRWLATSGIENTLCLWNETGQLVATLAAHPTAIRSIVFSPDSRLLATGCEDGYWRLWDVKTHQILGGDQGHSARIWDLKFSPDGQLLASSSVDGTAKLWDVATGQLLQTLTGHRAEVIVTEFSPDGQHLATGSGDRTIKIWEVATGQLVRTLTGHRERVSTIKYHPDGRLLVSGCADETIEFWDLTTGDLLQTCTPPLPYLGMNITGVTGLTAAEIDSLKVLGAVTDRLEST